MVPNAAEVARRRWTLAIIVRTLGAAMLLLAALPIVSWIGEGLSDGDLLEFEHYAGQIALAIFLLMVAFGLILGTPFAAKLLVPISPFAACPACRYRLEGLAEPRCPECGLPLSPEFMGGAPPRNPALRATASVLRARATLRIVFRSVGILLSPFVAIWLLSFTFAALTGSYGQLSAYDLISGGGFVVIFGIFTLLMLFRAGPLARWAVGELPRPGEERRGGSPDRGQ